DTRAVDSYWKSLNIEGRGGERRFLELDLVFPFLYGGVFAAALLAAWIQLGRPCDPVWVVLPVIVTVVADWTENLVQLGQLGRYQPDAATLDPGWIQPRASRRCLSWCSGWSPVCCSSPWWSGGSPTVVDGRVLGHDGDALLALQVHRIHDSLGDGLVFAEEPGLPEHGVEQSGLAVVDVGDDCNV